jgi:uncharacterized membrane protein YjjP (DUF1212 family)
VAATDLLLELGASLHAYGSPSPAIEETLNACANKLGVDAQFFSTPTAIFAAFGRSSVQTTALVRLEPGQVQLDKLQRVTAVAGAVLDGALDADAALARLREVRTLPDPYRFASRLAAHGAACAAACQLLGGGLQEILVAGVLGCGIGALAAAAARHAPLQRVFEPLAAFLAAFGCKLGTLLFGAIVTPFATLGSLIVLLPGLSLTVALTELAARHLASGTARLMGAGVVFLTLALGVGLGNELGELVPGVLVTAVAEPLPGWSAWVALATAAAAFLVLLRAPPCDLPLFLASALVAWSGLLLGQALFDRDISAFVGALAVGIGGNLFERITRRPSAIFVTPGLLLLVPGSLGFRSLLSVIERDAMTAVELVFQVFLVAGSLAAGTLVSGLLVPPRR